MRNPKLPAVLRVLVPFTLALASLVACDKGGDKSGKKPGQTGPAATTPAPTGKGVIQGVVKFSGTAPAPEPWGGAGNAECKSLRDATIQLVKVSDGKLEDAFVYVKDGLPPGTYPAATKSIEFDQKGCEFTPRVFGVQVDQDISAANSDKLMHNVKTPEFNQAFPFGVKKQMKLSNEAVMATIKCDVHPWMRAYAGVMSHPYWGVTKADGAFKIEGLVDGDYTLAVWHEKLGTSEQKVKVAQGAPVTADLELKGK